MKRSRLARLLAAASFACIAGVTFAQQALEIIPLRHRTVDQVLPALQPLLEPGATLSGSRGQLFLRASPANVAEIRRALEAIDRPSKRLQISVRLDDASDRERDALGASGSVSSRGTHIDITAAQSRRSAAERVDQRVQVLDGGRALIATGQSRPLSVPGGTVIQDLRSGFEVVPRVSGSEVVLEILQQREAPGPHPGSIQGQQVSSIVRTRLGEWVEVGGSAASIQTDQRGIASTSRTRGTESRRVWLKVEALD